MSLMPSLNAFRAWSHDLRAPSPETPSSAAYAAGSEEMPFPSTAAPTEKEQWLAL